MSNVKKQKNIVPGPVSDTALKKMVLKQPEREEREIEEYVESQARGRKGNAS